MKLIFGCSDKLAKIAAKRLVDVLGPEGFGPCQAVGIATGDGPEDKLLAVCVYNAYIPQHATCQISIVSWHPSWAKKGIIRALLSVPFEQYGVKKLWSTIASDNTRSLKFNLGIGFKKEATLCHQLGKNRHAVITYMMDKTFKQIYPLVDKDAYLLKDI